MLRDDGQGDCGSSNGGNSQQSTRHWENHGPVWRSCYEYTVVTSRLKQIEAAEGRSDQDEDVEALRRKRAELAKGIVDAAAPTIQELLLKVAMTASFLSEGEVGVSLTPQYLEECDRALAQVGDEEQCLGALEPELWALCQRVEELTAALEARWDCVERRAEEGRSNDSRDRHSLAAAWDELHESVWSVARYETMTTIGLRAKGKIFIDLMAFVTDMDGLFALQDSYLRDFDRLAYRRLHGKDSPMPRRSVG
jgi:hypothetical protein